MLANWTKGRRGGVCRGGWMPAPKMHSLSKNVTATRHSCWSFPEDENEAQFHWGVNVEGCRQWSGGSNGYILSWQAEWQGVGVLSSDLHDIDPTHYISRNRIPQGAMKARPTGVSTSHSKALKAVASPSLFLHDSMGIAIPVACYILDTT
jgi:hypothetical protein